MKSPSGVGNGSPSVLDQVTEQKGRIDRALSKVKQRVAIGSGRGGVGKSTITRGLAAALASRGYKVAIVDADFSEPTQPGTIAPGGAAPVPSADGIALPRSRDGVGIFSVGSWLADPPKADSAVESAGGWADGRAGREFSALSEIVASVAWGKLDVLLFDLSAGAERTRQFADFLGESTSFVLVTIPSETSRRAVVRSSEALSGRGNRLLGYVENMSGYYCVDCGGIKPLFPETKEGIVLDFPCLGRVPFDPAVAFACDRGVAFQDLPETAATRALSAVAGRLLESLDSPR